VLIVFGACDYAYNLSLTLLLPTSHSRTRLVNIHIYPMYYYTLEPVPIRRNVAHATHIKDEEVAITAHYTIRALVNCVRE
jgi:hypothetical protein